MSELKATPGPWLREGSCVFALNGMGTNRMYVGQHQGGVYDDHGKTSAEELCANLDLIAAAPELYAACLTALEEDSGMYCTDQLRAALAKARGET